jgi:tetratricopeptide (TPR) repeat protein
MPTKTLPSRPSLDQLKHQAKDLVKLHTSRDPSALQRIREFHPRFAGSDDAKIASSQFSLNDAQLSIAREYGFPSWSKLKEHVEDKEREDLQLPHHERIVDLHFRRAVDLLDAGDAEGLRRHLQEHPDLVRRRETFHGGNYFQNPTLLEFVAENPIRHGCLPETIVEVARVILEAGAERRSATDALELVSSGRVPRECGVQVPLIDLLCDYGAEPNAAMLAALVHAEWQAVEALLRRGARLSLPVAAATGRTEEARSLLDSASPEERHLALAYAAQFGHVEVLRMLLDIGEDPSRYNPGAAHSHSTPLHQAALAGHFDAVRLLVERGARLDMKDTLYHSIPRGWALHSGHQEIAEFLKQAEESPRSMIERAWKLRYETFQLVENRMAEVHREIKAAVGLARQEGNRRDLIEGLGALGHLVWDDGKLDEAMAYYEEALELCRLEGDQPLLAHTMRHLGQVWMDAGDMEKAEGNLVGALDIYRRFPDASTLDVANAVRPVAILREKLGETEAAQELWTEAQALYTAAGVEAGVEEAAAHLDKLSAPPQS